MPTERTAHLEIIAKRQERFARHVVVLRGEHSKKQRRDVAARLAAIPHAEARVIVALAKHVVGRSVLRVHFGTAVQYRARLK